METCPSSLPGAAGRIDPARRGPVAIVDDDAAVLASLEFLLQASGYDVLAYASPADFLSGGAVGSVACLIVDHNMPGMTGLDLIALLRTQGHTTPGLLVTSALTPPVRAQAARLGVDALAKPVDEADLLAFVAAYAASAGP